jgi:threonine synthase
VSIFILHPKGRVSPVQEAQMTTVTDSNVHNIAVRGTFDECQVGRACDRGRYASKNTSFRTS